MALELRETRSTELVAALHAAAMPEIEHYFATRDLQDTDVVLIAWQDGIAVGYLIATDHGDGGVDLWEHAVTPLHRHRGTGKRLLAALAERLGPGAIVRVDPAHQLDPERVSDYYSTCGFTHLSAGSVLWATATELRRAIRPTTVG